MKKIKFEMSKELVKDILIKFAQEQFPDYDILMLTNIDNIKFIGYETEYSLNKRKDSEKRIEFYETTGVMHID